MTEFFFDVEQGTEDWFKLRLGIPTASRFSDVLAKGEGKVRSKYMRQLAGEIITGIPHEGFQNAAMQRGHEMEPEARDLYVFASPDVIVRRVGFIRMGNTGCSPDSLVGDDGVLEIKTEQPDLLIETMLADQIPPKHMAQCQGHLMITGRTFCDLVIFYRNMPMFKKTIRRNEGYIKQLADEIDLFNYDLRKLVARIQGT